MNDLNGYLERMSKSIIPEKLFFLNKINWNEIKWIADIGNADGELLLVLYEKLSKEYPDIVFVGIDNNPLMLEKYLENINTRIGTDNNFYGYKNFTEAIKEQDLIKDTPGLIIFSSVLHEIPSGSIPLNFNCLEYTGVKYIAIRDMYHEESVKDPGLSQKQKEVYNNILDNYNYVKEMIVSKVVNSNHKNNNDEFKIDELDTVKFFYQLLLKYTYEDNWETESKEDYFSTDWIGNTSYLTYRGFNTIYDKKYLLQFKRNEVQKNLKYEMSMSTHRQMIFIKKEK